MEGDGRVSQYNLYNFGDTGHFAGLYPCYNPQYLYPSLLGSTRPSAATEDLSSDHYAYKVRIINPKNKKDYMELTWHDETRRFESIELLKSAIIENFTEYVPATPDFQMGYLEGRASQKRWIARIEDLKKMYEAYCPGDEIKLWCEGRSKGEAGKKRKADGDGQPPPKKEKTADEERKIKETLEEKHKDMYTIPQYTLWAKFIRMGRHSSYEEPPPIPLLTGKQKGRTPRKENISEALAGAATAFAEAMKPTEKSPTQDQSAPVHQLSPNNKANLRRRYLEDLRSLNELLNDGVLTQDEFTEQKETIMLGLRGLK